MIQEIIFDFDGTIADTNKIALETMNVLAEEYRFEKITAQELRSKSMREIINRRHIPMFKIPGLLKEYTQQVQTKMLFQKPINNLPELLNKLSRSNYSLSIITSNSVKNVSTFLNKHNLTFFNHIYSDKCLFGKHIVVSRFLRKYKINRKEAIYVGDEIRDIEAARKVNIKIISVTWGFNSREVLNNHSPDYLIDRPEQLFAILENHN